MRNKFSTANLPFKKDLGRKVPQQQNGCDCGVYTAKFIERFVQDVLVDPSNCYSKFLTKKWFMSTDIMQLRIDIRAKLLEFKDVADEYKKKNGGETKNDDDDDENFDSDDDDDAKADSVSACDGEGKIKARVLPLMKMWPESLQPMGWMPE